MNILIVTLFFTPGVFSSDLGILKNTKKHNVNSSDYPLFCDSPPQTNIDPEKCCEFPKFFDDVISQKCEEEFDAFYNSSVGDIVSDSCIIECTFNKSGLNKEGKLIREDVIKLLTGNAKNNSIWSQYIFNAINSCFLEVTEEDLKELNEHIKAEVGRNNQVIVKKICHPMSSIMLDCIYRELFKVCPQENFAINTTDCCLLRNYTITCDDW